MRSTILLVVGLEGADHDLDDCVLGDLTLEVDDLAICPRVFRIDREQRREAASDVLRLVAQTPLRMLLVFVEQALDVRLFPADLVRVGLHDPALRQIDQGVRIAGGVHALRVLDTPFELGAVDQARGARERNSALDDDDLARANVGRSGSGRCGHGDPFVCGVWMRGSRLMPRLHKEIRVETLLSDGKSHGCEQDPVRRR